MAARAPCTAASRVAALSRPPRRPRAAQACRSASRALCSLAVGQHLAHWPPPIRRPPRRAWIVKPDAPATAWCFSTGRCPQRLPRATASLVRRRADVPWVANPPYWALQEKSLNVGLRRAGFPEEMTAASRLAAILAAHVVGLYISLNLASYAKVFWILCSISSRFSESVSVSIQPHRRIAGGTASMAERERGPRRARSRSAYRSLTPQFTHAQGKIGLIRREPQNPPAENDSPLEETGFEPSVPRDTTEVSRGAHVASA
jgi:hypothetical protein